jgi:biofilm PGA synthesis N-glycosyltransferase PgaC
MAFLFVPALVLLILYVALIAYYHQGFRQLKNYESTIVTGKTTVTILIPARNEANNIKHCIASILKQTYNKNLLQIIVIDDFSTDNTAEIIKSYNPHVELLQLKNFIQQNETNSFKKKAITIGVQNATGQLIICTDADCIVNESWVSNIVSYYEKTNAQFIAATVQLITSLHNQNAKWNFVQIFQTIDFATLQGITAASVFKKFHTMCNGANLVYTKKAFMQVNGFEGIDHIASGDDMLLMHKIKTAFPNQVLYLKSANATVQTLTVPNWKSFFAQRIRWSSKASHYNDKKIFYALLLVYVLNVATLIQVVSLFFWPINWILVLLFVIVKSLVEYWFLLPVLQFYKQQFLKTKFWYCIPFHIIYVVIAGWFGKFGKVQWKGRTI